MFCQNCGNKLDENAYVCVNCGVILKKRSEVKIVKKSNNNNNTMGVISVILGSFSLLLSLLLFFNDISSVGMYTEIYERIFYALEHSMFAILLSSAALIFSLIQKKSIYNKFGLVLSFLSFFFIITEIIVVIIY